MMQLSAIGKTTDKTSKNPPTKQIKPFPNILKLSSAPMTSPRADGSDAFKIDIVMLIMAVVMLNPSMPKSKNIKMGD